MISSTIFEIVKRVAERSQNSRPKSRDRRPTIKQLISRRGRGQIFKIFKKVAGESRESRQK